MTPPRKTARVNINWRVRPAALAAIDEFATSRGQNRSDALRDLVRFALERRIQIPAPKED